MSLGELHEKYASQQWTLYITVIPYTDEKNIDENNIFVFMSYWITWAIIPYEGKIARLKKEDSDYKWVTV